MCRSNGPSTGISGLDVIFAQMPYVTPLASGSAVAGPIRTAALVPTHDADFQSPDTGSWPRGTIAICTVNVVKFAGPSTIGIFTYSVDRLEMVSTAAPPRSGGRRARRPVA